MAVATDAGAETRQDVPRGGLTRYVDGIAGDDQGGANDCSSQASPCLTISRAIDAAAAFDTIQIADAVYTELLTIGQSLTLVGESEEGTIVQAHAQPSEAVNPSRVVTISGSSQVSMADLTIRHGVAGSGAGIYITGAVELSLLRVTLYRNEAGSSGAGIYAVQTGCMLIIDQSSFIENAAGTGNGGGIHGQFCSVGITDSAFVDNSANVGGGLNIADGVGIATLDRVSFSGNLARNLGGGMHTLRSTTEIVNSVFRGNLAESADGSGGAGGGIFSNGGSDITLVNALVSGNLAGNAGGGIFVQSSTSPLNLINVTVAGNRAQAGNGGGISAVYIGAIHNSIVWNNQDQTGTGNASSAIRILGTDDVESSLIQGFSAADLGGSGNLDGTSAANNPQFTFSASPASAPTQDGDYHPAEFSPVVNAGDNALIVGYDLDLDGYDRIVEGIVDLGPYEFGNDFLFRDRFEF
ncbi:hypothetical protein G4Y73_08945 [Wenzhouxiangella sp. XN201]|uniref:hypothetical protein n=1 Tax=Wenzhouxiangella sp. XN201 TaxID=2710755 RepID=UPI0013CDDCEA|nr:hypothetical protein [Wenzhouxiangella sp. XN201]NEZ04269.1 hypothetical protein [Wenzhouxiangella sp. XN201]